MPACFLPNGSGAISFGIYRRVFLRGVIAASTVNAATALKRPELGSLKAGCVGDATILSIKEGKFDYEDVVGEHLQRLLDREQVVRPLGHRPSHRSHRLDEQGLVTQRVADLNGELFADEFQYWPRADAKRKSRR